MKEKKKPNKWIILLVLSLGGGLIYQLPYLRYTFYEPLRLGMGINHTQIGFLGSLYGLINLACHIPGGYVADKFSSRKLITFSLIATGGLGIWHSTFPSYEINILIFSIWGVITILTYWSAYLKEVGKLGEGGDTSRYYGIMDGIRGVEAATLAFIGLYVFRAFGETVEGVKWVILIFSFALIVVGIISWIVIPENKEKGQSSAIKVTDLVKIAKVKSSWLIAGIIFTTFGMLNTATYLVPYAETIFGASASIAVVLGIVRTHLMQALGGPSGGLISNKLKSTPKTLFIGYIVTLTCSFIFIVTPIKNSLLLAIIIATAVQSFMLSAMRGIYFSTIQDAGYPEEITGSVIGFASFVGFITDAFIFVLAGSWIESFGVGGYKMIFAVMVLLSIGGLILTVSFIKELKLLREGKQLI